MTMKKNVLLLKNITKEKAGSKVLDQFYVEILSGEIMNLIGLEGSGKEEIYSILFGDECADKGEVWFAGKKYEKGKELPVERSNGIFFIGNQELIIPNLSVAENLYIIEKINYFQFSVSKKKMELQARRMLEQFEIKIAPDKKANELNRYECYILRLMRAYVKRARLIVVDDILDDFSFERIGQIVEILERFKQEGISVLWINSYPDAITESSDKVVVIRQGRNCKMFYKEEYDRQKVFECMIGKKGPKESVQESKAGSRIIFQAENIQNDYFDGLDFCCRQGEMLGVYDLQDKFSRELRRVLLGRRSYSGGLIVDGSPYKADSEYKLVRSHIGVVDGNKYQSLIFPDLTVRENMEMAVYKKTTVCGCFINGRVKRYLDRIGMEICENSRINQEMVNVSRRDAMQIIYRRWQLTKPKILFCFQPFLRLDAVSRQQLEALLLEFKSKGTGIVLSSANISHLLPLCDRILVIEGNRIIREVEKEAFSEYF